MNAREIFEVWAPPRSPWSDWVKAPLFVNLAVTAPQSTQHLWAAQDLGRIPEADGKTALVVDLPGIQSLIIGLALTRIGFRPVPLYNVSPGYNEAVPTAPLRALLDHGANDLEKTTLAADAPPAFLIDSDRLARNAGPGDFDNRWMVFPQDFPSASFLKSQGIRRVVVLMPVGRELSDDLVHVLIRFQEDGLEVHAGAFDGARAPSAIERVVVRKPWFYRQLFRRALVMLGFRRSSAGGFGSMIPVPGPSSGYRGFG